jgi:hypothetical protein
MSGGSMSYFSFRLEEVANQFQLHSFRRRALRKLILKLAKALKAVEWNDSGDGDPQEDQLIDEVLGGPVAEIEEALLSLAQARTETYDLMRRLKGKL